MKLLSNVTDPLVVTLCSNILSNYEISSSGSLLKTFTPLKFIELKGPINSSSIVQLDKNQTYIFCGTSIVKMWCQEVEEKKRRNVVLHVRMSYRKK